MDNMLVHLALLVLCLGTQSLSLCIPDECDSGPCKNGGICEAGRSSYKCQCPACFTGINCETNIYDDCASSPCTNGGTCIDGVNSYICNCPAGYSGHDCSTAVGSTCISCNSTVDPSCTETSSSSKTVSCNNGACYTMKDFQNGVITRGCRMDTDLVAARLKHPEPGLFICSTETLFKYSNYICLCDGNNCNDKSWSTMGGTALASTGIADQAYTCTSDTCSIFICFMDTIGIRGCDTTKCQCKQ